MKRSFGALLLLCFLTNVQAQNTIGLPQIDNYSNIEFHGGRQTWDIKQDKWGRMYFANNEGLITYDGTYWHTYPQPNKSILRSIAIANNRIYAGGQDELGYFAPDSNGVLQYSSLKALIPNKYKKFTDVWEIEIFKESVFFRTWDMIFEYKNQTIQAYPPSVGWQHMKLAGDKLFAQDKQKGLFQFINGSWLPIQAENAIPNFEITGIVALSKDSFLVSSLENGLYLLSNGIFTKKKTAADEIFSKHHIYTFKKISTNEYVAGTTSAGCLVINDAGEIIQQISREDGLQNKNILSVYLDKEKNLWTGLDNGISFVGYNSAIKFIKPDKPNELSGYSAKVFDNKIYIATSDGAYMAPLTNNNKDLSFSRSNFEFVKNTGGQTWRLDEVNKQLLLGHNNGSFLIQNNEAKKITNDAGIWLFVPTSSIYPAKTILAGSYAGLTLFDFTENSFAKNQALSGLYESLRFLAIDNNNETWASHPYRGVYKIQLSADNKSFTTKLYTEKDGLPSTLRNYIFRIKNRVVVATEKGVYEFDATSNKFVESPLLYSVFGSTILQYLNEDTDGNIWFCSEKKIGVAQYSIEKKSYQIHYFPELTGKILSGFENVYPYNKNNVLIAANDGIIHLNFENYLSNNSKLNVLLTQVKAFGKKDSLIFGGYANEAGASFFVQNNSSIIALPISNNSLHFEFSSPSFGMKKNIEYAYQLVGYEKDWSVRSLRTEKDYTNIPSGSYTFKVKAFDNLGNESETISYSIVINPAWYNTLWAYLAYGLFVLLIFYLVIKWEQKNLLKQRIKFEEEQKRLIYIHQLEVEKNEKEIIELQNEKLINEVIYKNKELADASMHLVERNDALIKIKNELNQLHKKASGSHDLQKAIQLVNDIEKTNSDWENFSTHFDEVSNDFLKKLKQQFPQLTNADLKICAYLKLNLSSKEIAQLMNLAVRGVEISRYRLRKKLQLKAGESLIEFLHEINER
jgi:ligand-binding sensor domain-containing protein/DNA-binding CsgD family transcriptional regulator